LAGEPGSQSAGSRALGTLMLAAVLRRWVGRRLLTATRPRRAGLSEMSVIPKKLMMPLQRDGLDPVAELGRQRSTEAVTKLSRVLGMNVWLVSSYDQARAVLNDSASYSTDIRALIGERGTQPIGGLGFTDPPEHTRLRRFLTPQFTARRIAMLLPRVEQIVQDQLDVLEAGGEVVDLVSQFAFPIPFSVICELLGLPPEDREHFRRLGHARFDINGGAPGTLGAMSESTEFLLRAVRAQRSAPGDGLIGSLIREHGDEIGDVELAGLADGVFTGGYETSASMLALGTLALLESPDSFGPVGASDEHLDATVDELLRYLSVVQIAFPRFARHNHDLFGTRVSAGDVVLCSLSGANRDPAFGAGSDGFDPQRTVTQSHLSFGYGLHRCIGSELARMELRVAFRELNRRFPDMALAVPPDALKFRDLSIVFGVESLPVRLRKAASAT
jgi:cytochrome P450